LTDHLLTHCIGAIVTLYCCCATLHAGDFPVTEVAPGVFVHQGVHEQMNEQNAGNIGNSGFIVGGSAVAVIDPGGSVQSGRQLRSYIESVTTLPIEFVILSHFHPDHVIGASAFKDVETIIAHHNYPRAMAQRATFYLERFGSMARDITEEGVEPSAESGFIMPTRLVEETETIDLGERVLALRAHPTAHTDNDLTVVDEMTNTLWAADLVFAQRTPSLDGSLKGWQQVMAELSRQNYNLIIPGHGRPGSWSDAVAPQESYLAELKQQVKAQIGSGLSLSEVIDLAAPGKSTQWKLFDFQHPTNLTKAYTELEWD